MNFDGIEAEEQILAETSGGGFGGDVDIGGGDDADVDAASAGGADALELAGFQNAQELGLEFQGHVGDFVEKERAVVGELEAADAVDARVGEGAFDVAEEFAFEYALGKAAGVHGDHGRGGGPGRRVERGRDDLLAVAVLAGDETVGVGRADSPKQVE